MGQTTMRNCVGLLVEHLYAEQLPMFMASCDRDALPALRFKLEMERIDFAFVPVAEDNPAGGWVVFASKPFRCKPAPEVARYLNIPGPGAKGMSASEGPCALLFWAQLKEAGRVVMSQNWEALAWGLHKED